MKIFVIFGVITIIGLAACGTNPAERNNAGNNLVVQGSYPAAVSAYQAALVADPENAQLYFNVANAYARAGDTDAAITAYQQAIQRGDTQLGALAHYNLGNLFFEQQRYTEAVAAYQQSLLLMPNREDTRFNLELALLYIERPSPTPFEQKTEPDTQQANPSVTPTPNPGALNEPTPTPTPPGAGLPEGSTPDGGMAGTQEGDFSASPVPRNSENDLTVEDARRILDPIDIEEPGIGGGMPESLVTPATPASGRDW
jgi:tetratricopeptide (TPR) repeat protein